jgi:hypothetical protein
VSSILGVDLYGANPAFVCSVVRSGDPSSCELFQVALEGGHLVRVFDAVTQQELKCGFLSSVDPHFQRESQCGSICEATPVSFPLRLGVKADGVVGSEEVFVGSSGYSWERVAIYAPSGAERRVYLASAGTIRANIVAGRLPSADTIRFEVRRVDDDVVVASSSTSSAGCLEFGELPAGRYVVRGDFFLDGRSIAQVASGTVDVTSGGTASAFLSLVAAVEVQRVDVVGHLELPSQSAVAHARALIRVAPNEVGSGTLVRWLEMVRRTPSPAPALTWKKLSLLPGRYTIEIQSLGYAEEFTVTPIGTELVFKLPEPAPFLARLQLEGQPFIIQRGDLTCCRMFAGRPFGPMIPLEPSLQSGEYVASISPGQYLLVLDDVRTARVVKVVTVQGNGSTTTVDAKRCARLELELRCNGRAIPFPSEWDLLIRDSHGEELSGFGRLVDSVMCYRLPMDGAFEVEFDSIEGFEPLVRREFVVNGSEVVRMTLNLTLAR